MRRFAYAFAAMITISGCGSKSAENTTIGDDIQESEIAMDDAGQSGDVQHQEAENSECRGFVDGASRNNTLAGLALGDSLDKVKRQLRCGSLAFELEKNEVTIGGSDYKLLFENQAIVFMSGRNGNDFVEVEFIGIPGSEKLVSATRGGEYDGSSSPSVDGIIKSITQKYENAKILSTGVGYAHSTRVGFGSTNDGQILNGEGPISACSSRMGASSSCGTTLFAMIDPDMKRNPGLVRRYEIRIFNMSNYELAMKNVLSQLQSSEKNRMKKEVEGAESVKGI